MFLFASVPPLAKTVGRITTRFSVPHRHTIQPGYAHRRQNWPWRTMQTHKMAIFVSVYRIGWTTLPRKDQPVVQTHKLRFERALNDGRTAKGWRAATFYKFDQKWR